MARTLGEIKADVLEGLGRDDSAAVNLFKVAFNAAVEATASFFDPSEMRRMGGITYSPGEDELLVTSAARLQDVITVRNETDGISLGFIPLESLPFIVPAGNKVRFYSRDGNAILVRPTPVKETTIRVRYTIYPPRLKEDGDIVPFEGHEAYIIALSTAILHAFFEETDSATLWTKMSELLGTPYTLAAQARAIIEGVPTFKEKPIKEQEGIK